MTPEDMAPEDVLRQVFGYESFRPHQREIIDAVLAGRDVLAVMPTSAGKSICYQVPALMSEGVTVVISPLISLMADQVGALRQAGAAADYLNSSLDYQAQADVLRGVREGACRLLYVAPERLDDERLLDAVSERGVALLAVDEAHCISQWGNDFRPSYQRIRWFVENLPQRPPVCALTATATEAVRRDIASSLGLRDPLRVVASFDRPNLTFELRHPRDRRDKQRQLVDFVRERPDASGIVYCMARKTVEEVCDALRDRGIAATRYHAGLSAAERDRNQDDFIYDRSRVMVATNAFGMGIDKSNVGFVVHYNLPLSMEAYYQEAGRAGRDGTPATCLLLYSPADLHTAEFLISRTTRDDLTEQEERDLIAHDERRLADMVRYATSTGCLRHQILAYFGEDAPATCDNCSNCRTSWQEVDRTVDALKVVSCVARLAQRRRTVGAGTIAKILRGSTDQKTLDNGFDTLSTYGIMSDVPAAGIHDLISELVARGILARSEGAYPVIELTDASGPFLRAASQAGERFIVRVAREEPGKKNKRPGRERPSLHDGLRGGGTATEPTAPDGDSLYERLRAVRTELAREQGVPPYIICSNATLEDMCRVHPRPAEELLDVSGIGESKARRYGERFLAVLLEE